MIHAPTAWGGLAYAWLPPSRRCQRRTPATFAGILAYTEHLFGLSPLGVNDADAYDFRNAFNYSQAPLSPVHMVTRPLPARAKHLRITPALASDPS